MIEGPEAPNIASGILKTGSGQPVVGAPTPQTPSPGAGTPSGIFSAPIGPFSPLRGSGAVCVSRFSLLQRSQFQRYQGPVTANGGVSSQFPYVVSPPVPPNKFWIVMKASGVVVANPTAPNTLNLGLWLMPPGSAPPALYNGSDPGDTTGQYFANYGAEPVSNGPPPNRGLRIDQGTVGDTDVTPEFAQGVEYAFIRSQELYVPSGYQLMAYAGVSRQGIGGAGNQIELRLFYSEFDNSEDTQVL
jgi:hypothetical protein